jgi:hypothetical protein
MRTLLDDLAGFLRKTLTSRKFWAAVGASVPFAMVGNWQSFALVWCGYLTVQGAVDAVERVGAEKARLGWEENE